jgi:glycosyltransferase involved in cell wall biosynthesis
MKTKKTPKSNWGRSDKPVRVALVVPHIFMNRELLPHVIFSPGQLALDLAAHLGSHNIHVTLFTPGATATKAPNITADMSYFDAELQRRGYGYMELLKKHPATFVALARQVQAELIARAYQMANNNEFDLVHIYANEEDLGMQFASFCKKPVVFTHHDPFNFLIKYKSVMPKYKHLNWVSVSQSQRRGMPQGTNWVANIHHGLDPANFTPNFGATDNYFAFVGRIIEPKGVHIAIDAIKLYNKKHPHQKTKLKIAGKHYSDTSKDQYWSKIIEPELGKDIEYVGFLQGKPLNDFLSNAKALIVPSTFPEPFGMVSLEALASGTPVIGLSVGATAEIIEDNKTGFIISETDQSSRAAAIALALEKIPNINRHHCRTALETNFTLALMVENHANLYKKLTTNTH